MSNNVKRMVFCKESNPYVESENLHAEFREANDPDTPIERLIKLSKSADEVIRGAVARNKSTPKDVLHYLLEDESECLQGCLREHNFLTGARFKKPKIVIGNNLVFRDADIHDAKFILQLRTDPIKGKFLSVTSPELGRQVAWLESYKKSADQIYFIIENRVGEKVGTVRLYDIRENDSFCWGSWIIKDGQPSSFAIESALMVYEFALSLGFNNSHFDVRKDNESVWKFHERFGAKRVSETCEDYLYLISKEEILSSIKRYKKYLPKGIDVKYRAHQKY